MSEHDLRDVLHRVVPEAPVVESAPLAAAGRRTRTRRRRAGVVGAAVLVASLVVVVPLALPDRAGAPQVIDFAPPTDPVYDAVPCPAELPSSQSSNKTAPELDRVVGVRLCGDATPYGRNSYLGPGPSYPASPEALVEDMPSFVAAVRALPVPDPDRCATVDGISSRQSLAMLMDDGSTVLLGQTFCGDNVVDGQLVDAASVVQAFLAALDAQRDDRAYGVRVDPLTCATNLTYSPARPGREQLIGALACPDNGPDEPLDAASVARLQTAWADPRPITRDVDAQGENNCTELSARTGELIASTDRGDVIGLYASPCGYLVYSGDQPGESTRIPVAMGDLGLG